MRQETGDTIKNYQEESKYWKNLRDDEYLELKSWGSNVTNPSETAPLFEGDSSRISSVSDKDSETSFPINIDPPNTGYTGMRSANKGLGYTIDQDRESSNNP